ncbi:MAG: pyruvate dehydrogenase [Actinomycetales bacterium]|nr:pyruvate dehydrogenase [Actinomycetales bacterium]
MPEPAPDPATLDAIAQRVLWLAVRIVDHANRERDNPDGLKVGGHQASSASLVSVMTALWFAHLEAADRVSVKPHASPALHAINYLLGELDPAYLTRLREAGGLQAYPSLTKDPDRVDFSTGSVGLGATAPLFAAAARRYVDAHFGARPSSRFISLIGDAELDEGNIWEAVADPATSGLGSVMWVVDFNRQSLDRVVPGVRIHQWRAQFEAAGWHVVEVKYGRSQLEAFERPGGPAFRAWLDDVPNEQYQSLFGVPADQARASFLAGAPDEVGAFLSQYDDDACAELIRDLGGHDVAQLLSAFSACDAVEDRPSVVFAYTVKGWGLPTAGNPRNHSALLTGEQVDALRATTGLSVDDEWARFPAGSPEAALCDRRARELARPVHRGAGISALPSTSGIRTTGRTSTQEAFGRVVAELARDASVRPLLVTTAPDVATSTSLGGFINRVGVFAPETRPSWHDDGALRWQEGPAGQHIELGISEMNLFTMLGALGRSADLHDQTLLPIGTVYDPFVLRGLDALIHSVYSGARFVVAGTPSGVTLAPEGGAHQSTITASVGMELPGVVLHEPAYAQALDWLLLDSLAHVSGVAPETATDLRSAELAHYFRLTTRSIDQAPFDDVRARLGDAVLRRQVLAGAYVLVDGRERVAEHVPEVDGRVPTVHLVTCGALVPEVLAAAAELAGEGVIANVVDVTSPGRLFRSWQRTLRQAVRTATTPSFPGTLRAVMAEPAPIVSVHDAASHAFSWLGSALGVPQVALGVDEFGQSGRIADLYAAHDLDSGSIVNAALSALTLR